MSSEAGGVMTIGYDETLDAIVAVVSGQRTLEKARADWDRLFDAFEAHGTNSLLLDARPAQFDHDLEDWIAFTRTLARPISGKRIALVIGPELRDFGVTARMSAEERWNELIFFHDVDEAKAWLVEDGTDDA